MEAWEFILALLMGIGLAAACGFRVFVPLLALSIAAKAGFVPVGESFAWMATPAAIAVFALATTLEIGGYYIPWVDNLLDTIASPAAVMAGTIAAAALLTDTNPLVKWVLAAIAGGGAAGLMQVLTVATRATSSLTTGGIGNPVVSTGEAVASTTLTLVALLMPLLAALLVLMLAFFSIRAVIRWLGRRKLTSSVRISEPQPLDMT